MTARRRWYRGAAIAIALAATGPAAAKGPMYAYKAGVADADLSADETACLADARHAGKDAAFRQPYMVNPVTDSTVAGSAGSALARGFLAGMASAKRANTTLFDCMTARGYTMLRVSDEDWRAIKKLPPAERQTRMGVFRNGPTPPPTHPVVQRGDID